MAGSTRRTRSPGGWAIGDREDYSEDQDAIHASNIYYLLEREIVPLFYAHSEGGLSSEWVKRMKTSMKNLTPGFDARRMVHDYTTQLYDPAHQHWQQMRGEQFRRRARALAVECAGPRDLAAGELRGSGSGAAGPGDERQAGGSAGGNPAGRLEAGRSAGRMRDRADRLERRSGRNRSGRCCPNKSVEGDVAIFEREIVPAQTGRLGYAVRVSPNHYDDPLTRPVTSLLKWGSR